MNPPLTFDAILFDLDGTLADTARDIAAAIERALTRLELPVPPGLLALVDGSPLEHLFAVAAPGAPAFVFDRFVQAYRSEYALQGHPHAALYPGVRSTLEALESLRPRMRLAVATARRDVAAREVLDALDASRFFDVIAGSSGSNLPHKPAPDLLLHVCDRLSVRADRALMVGDTVRDIEAGRRAGMRTAAVTFGMGDADGLIAARPDYVLEEFDELLVVLGMEG
jgi:phosphoglycolate phosphatase